jgi:hypothetical protein
VVDYDAGRATRGDGKVTSAPALFRSSQSAAAARWLSTAPGPDAITPPIQRPRLVEIRCPTA